MFGLESVKSRTGQESALSNANEYVLGSGLISQITSAGTATYAHADGLGSIRLLTDATGAVVGTQCYDVFRATCSNNGDAAATSAVSREHIPPLQSKKYCSMPRAAPDAPKTIAPIGTRNQPPGSAFTYV